MATRSAKHGKPIRIYTKGRKYPLGMEGLEILSGLFTDKQRRKIPHVTIEIGSRRKARKKTQ